jgi:hypothetical protein
MPVDINITVTVTENGISRVKTVSKDLVSSLPGFTSWDSYINNSIEHLSKQLARGTPCDICGKLTTNPVQTINLWDGTPEIMCKLCYVEDGEKLTHECKHGHVYDSFGNTKCNVCQKERETTGECPTCGSKSINLDTKGIMVCQAPGCSYYKCIQVSDIYGR